ncbi:hypothetical protein D3C75_476200 [compost metagenome]
MQRCGLLPRPQVTALRIIGQRLVIALQGLLIAKPFGVLHAISLVRQTDCPHTWMIAKTIQRVIHRRMRLGGQQDLLPSAGNLHDCFSNHRGLAGTRRPLHQTDIRCGQHLANSFFLRRVQAVEKPALTVQIHRLGG